MFGRTLPLKLVVICLCLLEPCALPAQEKPKKTITIDDYFTQADIFEMAIESETAAYTEGRWQKSSDDRKTDLWIARGNWHTPKSQRLTFDRASYRSPQLSGGMVYVLANRRREGEKKPPFDGKSQVWCVPIPAGLTEIGQIQPVTQVEGGVEAYELCRNDHNHLLYLVHHDHQADDDFKALREKFNHIEYGQGKHKTSQIWKLNLDTWRTEKLIDAGRYIHEFTQSKDGKRLAMITAPDEHVVSFEGQSRIDLWEEGKITTLPDDVWRKKAASPYAWLEKLAWSDDGQMLAFNAVFDGYPAEIVVTSWSKGSPVSFLMTRPIGVHVRGYGSPLGWLGRDLCFLGEEKARVRLMLAANLKPDSRPDFTILTESDVVVENFKIGNAIDFGKTRSSSFVIQSADPSHFADLHLGSFAWRGDEKKGPIEFKRITNVNPQAESWKLPKLKVVSWKGARGDNVEGILELPHDYKAGTKIPLVVEIHGGPTTATLFKQQFWIYGRTLLPAQGYAVLCPNYRGSTGYGDKFLTDLIGRENDLDVQDILKGVDAMIDEGIADPNRLAVSGWSNGGYLTNCLISKTTRFKAAISGAGIVDAIMEFGSNDEPAYAIVFKQGFPWSNPEKYHKASSTYRLDKIKTPTLIHVGANDERCPPGHSKLLFRALKEYNKVDTQLLVYPGESHGLMKYKNRQAKLEWDLAWLAKYLK